MSKKNRNTITATVTPAPGRRELTTPEQKQATLTALSVIADGAGKVLFDKATVLYANLTDQERQQFSAGGQQFYRAAKVILCAVADEVENQYTAEAILLDICRARKIRRTRYC